MNPYDSVDKRLSALAEWLKSNATDTRETSNGNISGNKLYQNHVTYFHHPYANLAGQFGKNGFVNHTNKPHRERTTFTESHLQVLERCFNEIKHPDTSLRGKLATELGLPVKTIQVWFQNRRARERKGGKEKRISDGGVKDWQNFSGLLGSNGSETSKSNSTTSAGSLKTCATAIVQELESSKKQEETGCPDTENRDSKDEDFTIIHIPEELSSENTDEHQQSSVCKASNETDIQEMDEETSIESTTEQQFAVLLGNLDLDLIVKTYQALQSSENTDDLIENWLAYSSGDDGANELTLEENLKHFIQFSQTQ